MRTQHHDYESEHEDDVPEAVRTLVLGLPARPGTRRPPMGAQ